jgi:predicted O-methyltransferase YrrM
MDHFYQDNSIEGWFDFENVYSLAVKEAPQDAHFVEVGVWKGKSVAYMAVEIINSGKNIKFDCVDTWEYVPSSSEITQDRFDNLYDIFLENIHPVKDKIGIIKELSWEGAKHFVDNSLDFVFIDAAHDYDSVLKDITAWYPKVKRGGRIGGHDYGWSSVSMAVKEYFKDESIEVINPQCWMVNKQF